MSENRFDPAAHARSMRTGGFWVDKNFDEFLQATIEATPGKLALLADRADRAEARRFTYAELGDLISRAAASLRSRPSVRAANPLSLWERAGVRACSAARELPCR